MFLELLEQQQDFISVPAGTTIFRKGDRGTVMYGVARGAVDIYIDNVVLEIVGPGMIFGEMALLDDDVRSASASVRIECRLVQIDSTTFDALTTSNSGFAREIMKIMARRLRHMNMMAMEASNPNYKE
jgi:CRP-like cAMP-binding protein